MLNFANDPIVNREKIIFPLLHLKLGFMKQLADSECFQYIVSAFPALSYEKIKAGVFIGPQIRVHIRVVVNLSKR